MTDAASLELVRALELMDHAKLELENAAAASASTAASFLGDADRFLIDANAAVWRACQALGCAARPVSDSSRTGESDPRRAAKAALRELADARADVERLASAVRTGTPLPTFGPETSQTAQPAPADDPFGTPLQFDPKNSLKHDTRRRGIKLLAIGLGVTLLGFLVAAAAFVYGGDLNTIWLAFPLLGLGIAGKGFIEILHSRDM